MTPAVLSISRQAADVWICWPETCTEYVLQVTPHLNHPIPWEDATNQVTFTDGRWCVRENVISGTRFYQLRKR
jgi:hypothetical protein